MKKILVVTGGAGFVGSNLISFLIKKTKYKIISIDNYSSGFKKNHVKNTGISQRFSVGNPEIALVRSKIAKWPKSGPRPVQGGP